MAQVGFGFRLYTNTIPQKNLKWCCIKEKIVRIQFILDFSFHLCLFTFTCVGGLIFSQLKSLNINVCCKLPFFIK